MSTLLNKTKEYVRSITPDFLQGLFYRYASSYSSRIFLREIQARFDTPDFYIDVGAADGEIFDIFHEIIKLPITSLLIEPRHGICESLKSKYKSNKSVEILNSCITSDGRSVYFSMEGNGSNIYGSENSSISKVYPTKRLDSILKNYSFQNAYLKLDTQGSELEVLESLGKYQDCISFLAVECTNFPNLYGNNPTASKLINYISTMGLHLYMPGHIFYDSNGFVEQFDLYFVREKN